MLKMLSNPSSNSLEYELKLVLNPVDLQRFRRLPILSQLASGRGRTQQLKSVYFDTPDNALRSRLVGLRVRSIAKRQIQCLKTPAGNGAGDLARMEWEMDIAGELPQLEKFEDSLASQHLVGIHAEDLAPRFATLVSRRTRILETNTHDVIELAIDEGRISAQLNGAEYSEPVCEIELELKSGSPKALYELALAIHREIPVRVLHQTKAERGYRLLDASLKYSLKANSIALNSAISAESAIQEIMYSCLAHWKEAETVVLNSHDTEGVHQLRVALRRMHSVLRLFKPLVHDQQVDYIQGELKWLISAAGLARDLDVFLDELLAPITTHFKGDNGLFDLRRQIERKREMAYAGLRDVLKSHRYTQLLLSLGRWLEGRGWREQSLDETSAKLFNPLRPLTDVWLQGLYTQTLKLGDKFSDLSVKKRHRLRISIKRLRYATEFFSSLYGKKSIPFVKRLKVLQDQLGVLNDIAATKSFLAAQILHEDEQAHTRNCSLYGAAGIVIGWQSHDALNVEHTVCQAWEKFLKAKPFWNTPSPEGVAT